MTRVLSAISATTRADRTWLVRLHRPQRDVRRLGRYDPSIMQHTRAPPLQPPSAMHASNKRGCQLRRLSHPRRLYPTQLTVFTTQMINLVRSCYYYRNPSTPPGVGTRPPPVQLAVRHGMVQTNSGLGGAPIDTRALRR